MVQRDAMGGVEDFLGRVENAGADVGSAVHDDGARIQRGESVDLVDEDLSVVAIERDAVGDDERVSVELHDASLMPREVAKLDVGITRIAAAKAANETFPEAGQCLSSRLQIDETQMVQRWTVGLTSTRSSAARDPTPSPDRRLTGFDARRSCIEAAPCH